MIVDTSVQGSLEWFCARAGVITASKFSILRETARLKTGAKKGQYNSESVAYMFKCAVERISGLPLEIDDGFDVWQAKRGHGLEPHAKFAHELRTGILVEEAGFIKTDDGLFGASADGFAWLDDRRIGCEYKCFLDCAKASEIILYGSTDTVVDQCEGGMWITGLNLWHFGLFFPALTPIGLEFKLIPIERDDERLQSLEDDLWTFNLAVEGVRERLQQLAGMNSTAPMAAGDPDVAREVNAELQQLASTELPEDIFG